MSLGWDKEYLFNPKKKKKTVLANLQSNDLQALGNSELVHAEYCDMILYDFKVMFICGL